MKIQIIKIGKPAHKAYEDLVANYAKRLRPIWKIDEKRLKAVGESRAGRELFAKLGLSDSGTKLDPSRILIILDERGAELSSPGLASFIESKMQDSQTKAIDLVIGGPFGISDELRQRADFVWSLSKAVIPSDLAWLMVWEQLYRAASIIRGSAYHHI